MDNRLVGIHQPNFMPWLGYFYKIAQSDVFIFLDDVQFIKTGSNYTNRVSLNVAGVSKPITIPIKRSRGVQNINMTKILDERWKKKLIGTIQANYAKSKYFEENRAFIFELINFKSDCLATYNINFIESISKRLNFNTEFIKSSEFGLHTSSTERLIDLIERVDGSVYLSGSGGDNYQDKQLYVKSGIELIYTKIPKFEYQQNQTEKFIAGLSIIDAIFNIGIDGIKRGNR